MAHIPPGYATPLTVRFMAANFNKRFIDILFRHSDVIVGTHFGHEHHDNFRLVYSSTGMFYFYKFTLNILTFSPYLLNFFVKVDLFLFFKSADNKKTCKSLPVCKVSIHLNVIIFHTCPLGIVGY